DVYVHALDDQAEVMAGLARASGFLRRELAQRVRLRNVPVLHFHWDVSVERGERIDQILESLDLPPEPAPDASDEEEQDPDGLGWGRRAVGERAARRGVDAHRAGWRCDRLVVRAGERPAWDGQAGDNGGR